MHRAPVVVRARVLGASLVVLLALAGPAHAAMFFSGENATGVSNSGVGALHANIQSTSSLVYTATFDFGLTTAYGTSVAGSTGANNVPAFFNGTIHSVAITGLACGTTYHWRLNVAAADVGPDQTLTTSPCMGVSPAGQSYGSVAVSGTSAQTFTISNTSASPITVSSIAVGGADAADFDLATVSCASLAPTLAAGASCTVSVTFSPGTSGAKAATLDVVSDAPDSPESVALSGTGSVVAAVPTVSEWGMIILGLCFVGFMVLSSRRGGAGRVA